MSPATAEQLAHDLSGLGVQPGDTLFIHSSFKSLGPVEGGAVSVVAALEACVGPEGLILMPSFNLVHASLRPTTWDHATTPATTGHLCEFFRKMPGTYRSDHYSHSVAARGKGAAEIVSGHRDRVGMKSPWDLEPWGRTYGTNSPMLRAYDRDAKVLMLGVDYHSSTYMHVVEVMFWNQRLQSNPQSSYNFVNRELLGAYWDSLGRLSRGKVGQANCRLFSASDFVNTLLEYVRANPRHCCNRWTE